MLEHFFTKPLDRHRNLQQQIQERITEAILAGALPTFEPLPATRLLAQQLGVSRNTVSLVYERLAEDGYLKAVERRGYFVDERYIRDRLDIRGDQRGQPIRDAETHQPVDYAARMMFSYVGQTNITKPVDWSRYAYPFIYGQHTPDALSVGRWRDCVRQAGTAMHLPSWVADMATADDPMLVDQIIRRILPKRGFSAETGEVVVTVGAQNALFLVATLLCGIVTTVAVEEPGYVDARNIFLSRGATLMAHDVDGNGLRITERIAAADLVYTTPGHQSPTNVTMSMERRLQLLDAADRHDFLIVEDDYEHELNFIGTHRPALKALDKAGRVIYIGSLSKSLFPGLRLGFIVAPPALADELRALRRLVCRHPSALDQRAFAIFLGDGHFEAHIRRQRDELAARWKMMLNGIERSLPDCDVTMTTGGSGLWLTLPAGIDGRDLVAAAATRGVFIEPGDVHYLRPDPPRNRVRLGFGAIARDRIPAGLAALADALAQIRDRDAQPRPTKT